MAEYVNSAHRPVSISPGHVRRGVGLRTRDVAEPNIPDRTTSPIWYAIVLKRRPDDVLAIDRSLAHAWSLARAARANIHDKEFSVRTLTENELNRIPQFEYHDIRETPAPNKFRASA